MTVRGLTASIVHEDPYMAGRDTAAEILAGLGASPDVILTFVSSRNAPERVLEGMWSRLSPKTRILGCSSYAEITAEDAVTGSVTAMGLSLGGVDHALFAIDCPSPAASHEAGRALGGRMLGFDPGLVIVLADGVTVNSPKLIRGMQDVLGATRPIVGGVSADRLELDRTFELLDREVLRGGVVALALRGPLDLATSSKAGFQPVGVERTCTRVEDERLILELDGVSALKLYEEMLGPDSTSRPNIGAEFPLAIVHGPAGDYMSSDDRSQVLRVVWRLDQERGGLLCGGDVHTGAKVRMTSAAKDDLVTAATLAIEEVKRKVPAPAFALLFSCAGRKLVLGSRYHEEIRGAFGALGPEVPRIGFYTYGEIAPVGGVTRFHAETFTAMFVGVG